MSQLNSSTATHISPKILCQYLPILVWSGAYAPGRRCRRKTSEKNPFFRNSNALMYTLSHFWRNGSCAHKCYFWNKFQKCLLGNIPKPLQNAAGAFCKNVVKNWKTFAKILCGKKSSSGDFLFMFLLSEVEQKHAEKFRFVKNLASCFQICYSKCRKEQPLTKWLTSWSGNKPTRIRQETR